ncbi:MAG: bifunctional folylpolyglutamate synthase/dihydrofolate synthase [Desulfatitalea sp.]|nr:bifunctional folylpolyglutamate synthase/dihydrofolate synthase [Desulfatitalea sp.]NNK02327.1 bifunctional folylpolyglutamate synthase/dihydrofolate synthase [Desulfatitalea sp.]
MFRLHRFGIKLGLETISTMLAALGNPQKRLRCIHIAGTNGKGSVAAMLSTILQSAGYRVGRYTSPHLERFNERICINNTPISDQAVVEAYRRAMAVNHMPRQPTFFEFTTVMALDQFHRERVQWAVIETGMGGRLDATNVIHPELTIITNISLEHREYLGTTIRAIAGEKAGIIKRRIPVISGVGQPAARDVVHAQAASKQALCRQFGRDFRTRRHGNGHFTYYGINHTWRKLALGLMGDHQIDNAALALAACELLDHMGAISLGEQVIRQGIRQTQWPGRLEVAGTAPYLILDGAHNQMAARVLGRHLQNNFGKRRITLVVGLLDDKPQQSIIKDLAAPCQRVIVTQPEIDRAVPAGALAALVRQFCPDVEIKTRVDEALRFAIATSGPEDVICVAGSLYVVGEAKAALKMIPIA